MKNKLEEATKKSLIYNPVLQSILLLFTVVNIGIGVICLAPLNVISGLFSGVVFMYNVSKYMKE